MYMYAIKCANIYNYVCSLFPQETKDSIYHPKLLTSAMCTRGYTPALKEMKELNSIVFTREGVWRMPHLLPG